MNVFLCRLKTEGRDGRNRIKEALDRNEIWIGWDVCHLIGKGFPYETVVRKAKELFSPTSKAPKQIGLFVGKMKKKDLVISCPDGAREFFVGEIAEDDAHPVRVPWLKEKLPGRNVNWLNYKRPLPIALAPLTVRRDIHKNLTCFQFGDGESLSKWARQLIGHEFESRTTDKGSAFEAQERHQGYQSNQHVKDAVEAYAMKQAELHYGKQYDVDAGKARNNPFDMECTSTKKTIYVEVKGTQTSGDEVILTEGEKEHLGKNVHCSELFVLHHIRVTGKRHPRISGGQWRIVKATRLLNAGVFRPTQWRVTLPKGNKRSGWLAQSAILRPRGRTEIRRGDRFQKSWRRDRRC